MQRAGSFCIRGCENSVPLPTIHAVRCAIPQAVSRLRTPRNAPYHFRLLVAYFATIDRVHQQGAGEIARTCFHIKAVLITPRAWFHQVLRDLHTAIRLPSRPLPTVRLYLINFGLLQPLTWKPTPLRHIKSKQHYWLHPTRHYTQDQRDIS